MPRPSPWDRQEVRATLPKLRKHARLLLRGNAAAADELVERVLIRAVSEIGGKPVTRSLEDWLVGLLFRMARH